MIPQKNNKSQKNNKVLNKNYPLNNHLKNRYQYHQKLNRKSITNTRKLKLDTPIDNPSMTTWHK